MLIKEYRIPLPMSVEEYRIAQLYMIQKKSRLDSIGEGSGVEILENTPYTDGPGGSGQYTKKIYHIGSHLPGWLKAILPKAALRVEEEAWNAYPYTKMRTTCPFVEKFFVDVETYYYPDAGQQENVFNLSPADLQGREVDIIDPVKDAVSSSDYCEVEDPLLYKSQKTGRGPMKEDWLEHYRVERPPSDVMCAYKLIKVEFRYWGMQNKIEHFIHSGLRRPMLMGHRQAWVWQDEWHGLTIEDIRQLEEETQRILARKMGALSDNSITNSPSQDRESDQEVGFANDKSRGSVVYVQENNNSTKLDLISKGSLDDSEGNVCLSPVAITVEKFGYDEDEDSSKVLKVKPRRKDIECNGMSQKDPSSKSDKRRLSQADYLKEYRMSTIETAESDSEDDEFFDAQEELEDNINSNLLSIQNVDLGNSFKSLELDTDSSRGSRESLDSIASSITDEQSLDKSPRLLRKEQLCKKVSDTSTCSLPSSRITSLILVIHGGTQVDTGLDPASRDIDFKLLRDAFEAVVNSHYIGAAGRLALRIVECPAICSKALNLLSQLCPYSEGDSDMESVSSGFTPVSSSFPLSAISLMVSSSPFYCEAVNSMVVATNMVYRDFLRSEEGQGFRGEVCLLGDCMGALLAFDALTSNENTLQNRTQSFISSASMLSPHSPTVERSDGDSVTRKPRRISSHTPPSKSSLENSRNLRLSFSSGNIREKVDPDTDEIIRSPPVEEMEENVLVSPYAASKAARLQTFSFDNMSLSVDSVDHLLFDFEVSKFFAFGSPIGLVLAYRRFMNGEDRGAVPPKPACNQVYNLFHPFDPSASRIEPLIINQFSHIPPVSVPRYHRFPLGDGQSHLVNNVISAYPEYFTAHPGYSRSHSRPGLAQQDSNISTTSLVSSDGSDSPRGGTDFDAAVANWWGTKRVDFALYCPESLQQFPTAVLSPLFHVSYWESSDVAAFVVREILQGEWNIASVSSPSKRCQTFSPSEPREKWLKRRTAIKIKNLNANHRANDRVALEGREQTLSARFMYGPLDMVSLSGEKVDIYVMTQPPSGEYVLFDTAITGSGGRLSCTIPEDKKLPVGIYPVKLVVRGDHTWVDSNLAVLPPKTEAVVFSIDGSFTASVSIRGKDPKVRAGAVDVVRHWQELGFLIVYVTSRPDFQKIKVMSWLAEHNFPYGLVSFGNGISKDIQRHKTEFLRYLVNECQVQIYAAYGSVKDISVYSSIGIKPHQIYTVGKHHPRKYDNQAKFLKDGYAAHLTSLSNQARSAVGNSRMILRRGCFGLPSRLSRTKQKIKRSISDKASIDSPDKESSTISGSFNYSSFRHTKGRSVSKFDQDY